jgi:hypothetical protein
MRAALLIVFLAGCGSSAHPNYDGTIPPDGPPSADAPHAADAAPTADADQSTGMIMVSWTITQGGMPATCAAVGANHVKLSSMPNGPGLSETDIFQCDALSGTTFALRVGSYNERATLYNDNGTPSLSDDTVIGMPFVYATPAVVTTNTTTVLAPATFNL